MLLLEVIEHVPDPIEFFAAVSERVPTGGYVMITPPLWITLLDAGRKCLYPLYGA